MSYILDALKKSEKERQRGSLPDMLTVQDIVAEKPGKRLFWAYLLAAILLLNAGVFVWWQGVFHTKEAKITQNSMTDSSLSSSVNDMPKQSFDAVKPDTDSMQSISPAFKPGDSKTTPLIEKQVSSIPDMNTPHLKRAKQIPDVQRNILPEHSPATNNTTISNEFRQYLSKYFLRPNSQLKQTGDPVRLPSEPTGGLAEIPDDNKIYKLKELPLSIGQKLPRFSISALLYSDNPVSRMVRINDQMMYEGQDLTEGLKLEEITKDGVILRHQKYRIWVGLK